MAELPTELLILLPLALAAGVDLYLTLLVLGAAPTTPWWSGPLPGALADLDSLGVLIMVGSFYLLEFIAERTPPVALAWNTFHAVIRPVAGILLGLLLLDGQPTAVHVGGALLAGGVASLAHAARSGRAIMRWLDSASARQGLLVSLFEDALVLGTITLALDRPLWALYGSLAALLLVSLGAASDVRAFFFAVRLAIDVLFESLGQHRWRGSEELPAWVREALEGDILAPGGGLRGSPVGAHGLPGAPRFATGWIVIRGGSPVFVFRWRSALGRIDLGSLRADDVVEASLFRRVKLQTAAGTASYIFFGLSGPSREALRAEFLVG